MGLLFLRRVGPCVALRPFARHAFGTKKFSVRPLNPNHPFIFTHHNIDSQRSIYHLTVLHELHSAWTQQRTVAYVIQLPHPTTGVIHSLTHKLLMYCHNRPPRYIAVLGEGNKGS